MTGALYAVVSGSLAALRRLEITTNNLANVNTAGFKAQHLLVVSRNAEGSDATGVGDAPSTPGPARTAISDAYRSVTDLSQGPIRESGNPLDVAITGPGFFVVSTPSGERYTRQGQFHLDGEGTLVTAAGDPVQGTGGDEINLPAGRIEIDRSGVISVNGSQAATLRLVRFPDPTAIIPEGATLFSARPDAAVIETDVAETQVLQGSIEAANVDAIKGLLDLIDVSRGYEAYMRAMTRVDGTVRTAVQQVGA